MITFPRCALAASIALLAAPGFVAAQVAEVPGFDKVLAQVQERLADNRYVLREAVEMSQGDMKFYADFVEYFGDTNRLVATGNVLVIEPDHQIAADRADFNARTRLGTFHNARGFATLGAPPGAKPGDKTAPLEPDVQFYGETLEKISADTYLITNGGFTSCVQANPRWEMTSGSLRLRVDHYALLRNMLLKVKGVPAIYLPVMYYPLSKDNRNTGFLMPTYGGSSVKGQTIGNAFFWAINRSQDATFMHDWYSKTGQAIAGEYRYVSLGGSGNVRSDFLNENALTYLTEDGEEVSAPGRRSFRMFGNLNQRFGRVWQAQAQADYSSDLDVDQLYNTDITRASRRTRSYGGSISGTAAGLRLMGRYDRQEYFADNGTSSLRSNTPRINVSRPDRLVGRLPFYASVNTEFVNLEQRRYDTDHIVRSDEGLGRLDIVPTIRYPFSKLPYLSFTTTATFRNTFWSRSLRADANDPLSPLALTSQSLTRQFLEVAAEMNGPTLVRIWDAPNSSYAQRFRHSIEPFVQTLYRTAIDDYNSIPKLESSDYIVGRALSVTYGMNTRFYAKKTTDGPRSIPREVVRATIRQTYNTDANSILSDAEARSRNALTNSHFTAVALTVRTSPWEDVNGTFRTDFDGRYSRFKQFSADGSWEKERISLLSGWSQVRFRPDALGNNVAQPDAFLQFRHHREISAEPLRPHAHGELGHQGAGARAAAVCRLLQRAVLRLLGGISAVRPEPSRQRAPLRRIRASTSP